MAAPQRPAPRGFLNLDKPAGITSFDAVRKVRQAAGVKRVGHAGTLDPAATGVLPIAVGEATRLVDELTGATKRYRGVVTLGVETDTADAEGVVTARHDPSAVTEEAITSVLREFRGQLMQTPPAYSAVKRAGVPAYKAARSGTPHELDPRPVTVHSLEVVEFRLPEIVIDVECGKGFYVRALAHDLGRALGVGAHLSALRRTAVGQFAVEHAVPLDEAVERLRAGDYERLLHAPDAVLTHWPALILGHASLLGTRQGRDYRPSPAALRRAAAEGERARGYGPDGELLALFKATAVPGEWHPYRVFASPAPEDASSGSDTLSHLCI